KDDLGIKQLIYRVRYGCEEISGIPPGSIGSPAQVCPPNPATDPPGCALGQDPACHPVDGGYPNPDICTTGTGNCVPANIVFANVAEDEMCIGVVMYWPLDEILNQDGSLNEQAIQDFESDPNNINKYGTPDGCPSHRATSATARAVDRVYEPFTNDRRIRDGGVAGSLQSSFRGSCARLLLGVGLARDLLQHSRAVLLHRLSWRQRQRRHVRQHQHGGRLAGCSGQSGSRQHRSF